MISRNVRAATLNALAGAAVFSILFLLASPGTALAQGTGVGNGDTDARDQYLAELEREMPLLEVPGIDGAQVAPLSQWCSRVSRVLLRERERALSMASGSNVEAAELRLLDALSRAGNSLSLYPENGTPLTLSLIQQALEFSAAMQMPAPGDEAPVNPTFRLLALTQWIDLITDAERRLDRPYVIPYLYSYNRCHGGCPAEFSFQAYQAQYVEFARRQIQFVLRTFTERVREQGEWVIYPEGPARVFLKVSETMARSAARDVAINLYGPSTAWSAEDLRLLSEDLRAYNDFGDRTLWRNDRLAVRRVAAQLRSISDELGRGIAPRP